MRDLRWLLSWQRGWARGFAGWRLLELLFYFRAWPSAAAGQSAVVGIILARMLLQYPYELYQLKFYNYTTKCEMPTSFLGLALVFVIDKDGSKDGS